MKDYNPQKIEKKWQRSWKTSGIYQAQDRVDGKDNFYHLVMFPYSSGDLHIGHWYNFAGGDVYARLKRMQGKNVMLPIGFDSFGLPAENAAIKHNTHPKTWTEQNIKRMRKQIESIGGIYDWQREVITCHPGYYKWTQWIFLQLYKAGLVYRDRVPCNFCPSCKTVLANEQVVEGGCERCQAQVTQKEVEQWLFKITDYAETLLKDLEELDWPETTKTMQKNWIGRSEGWQINFKVAGNNIEIPVFTTRADTLFGCTYLVVAPEHSLLADPRLKIQNSSFVRKYIEASKNKTERERISEITEKTGVELRGIKAVNPVNSREIPVFVADYVLMHYGTGAVMAVPAHDNRDWDFAKKYNLSIIKVLSGGKKDGAYEGEGVLLNSGRFTGMRSETARERMGQWLQQRGVSQKKVYYRLRDWLISRQRYWGVPIPMVFCEKHGWQPVEENDLPVLLPKIKDFRPTSQCRSPLANSKEFTETVCPQCKGPARRETDTMDTFVCSSWYFLRYADSGNNERFASASKLKDWLPVDMYIGGAEHSVLHLLYSRFITKALEKAGYIDFSEPFSSLRHQGIIFGPDGQKMSKSKGNVVDPDKQVKKHGADAVRMYLCFMGPYNQGGHWNPNGIVGVYRFLNRVWQLFSVQGFTENNDTGKQEKIIHQTIKKITEDIESLRFNTAISALMILVNELSSCKEKFTKNELRILLLLLAPFAPHITEELWFQSGWQGSIHCQKWPKYDSKLIKEEKIQLIIQINGKVRDRIEVDSGICREEAEELTFKQKKVKNRLSGKTVKKVVFVPGKLINLVI